MGIRKEYHTSDDSKIVGSQFVFTVRGKLVAHMGSPKSDGTFWTGSDYPPNESPSQDQKLAYLLRKQDAIRLLFSTEGAVFEIDSLEGTMPPLKCNPRVRSIEFPEGKWVETCDYVITLEADTVQGGAFATTEDSTLSYVSRASEEWNIETLDEHKKTYRLTHSLSATGKRHYDVDGNLAAEAWAQAKTYVHSVIGLGLDTDRMIAADVLDGTSLQAFNYLRSNVVNERGGTYSVTETWVCYDPQGGAAAIDESTIETRYSIQDNRTTVTIQGTVTGLEQKNNTTFAVITSRWANAQSKWTTVLTNLLSRAQTISGATLNTIPVSTSVGKNDTTGVITYAYQYDNRATPNTPGALSEIVSITNFNQGDVFAKIPVLGREIGPVLQDISTKTEKKRNISIEVIMPAAAQGYDATQPNTNSLLDIHKPTGTQVFMEHDDETWVPNTGRYTRTTSYTYEE